MAEQDSSFPAFARRMTAWRLSDLDRELDRAQFDRGADAVHDLRVAARRLQYTLDCFRSMLDSPELSRLRKRVKAILAAGRFVRDRDIAMELAAEAGLGPGSELVTSLSDQRDAAAEALRSHVMRPRYRGFDQRWADRLGLAEGEGPTCEARPQRTMDHSTRHPGWDAAASCLANARRVLPQLVSELLARGREVCAGEPAPQELHQLRLAGKRLRYSLELFRGLCGPGLDEVLKTLKSVQTILGDISDCDATDALVRSEGLANSADGSDLLRSLEARRTLKVLEFTRTWRTSAESPDSERRWAEALGGRLQTPGNSH